MGLITVFVNVFLVDVPLFDGDGSRSKEVLGVQLSVSRIDLALTWTYWSWLSAIAERSSVDSLVGLRWLRSSPAWSITLGSRLEELRHLRLIQVRGAVIFQSHVAELVIHLGHSIRTLGRLGIEIDNWVVRVACVDDLLSLLGGSLVS